MQDQYSRTQLLLGGVLFGRVMKGGDAREG